MRLTEDQLDALILLCYIERYAVALYESDKNYRGYAVLEKLGLVKIVQMSRELLTVYSVGDHSFELLGPAQYIFAVNEIGRQLVSGLSASRRIDPFIRRGYYRVAADLINALPMEDLSQYLVSEIDIIRGAARCRFSSLRRRE